MTTDRAPQADEALGRYLRTFPKGSIIFDQGETGRTLYFIKEGRVRISKVTAQRLQPLAVLEPGTFFGEMAVLTGEPRSARAEALDDCVLLEIDGATFEAFLDSHPEAARRMIHTLVDRLQRTDQLIERLLTGDPTLAVVEALLEHVDRHGPEVPIRNVHALMVASGTDPTLLRWILGRLKRAGFVRVEGGALWPTATARLREYANFLRLQRSFLEPESADGEDGGKHAGGSEPRTSR